MPKWLEKLPKYRRHSSRDLAFVVLNGKRHYLPGRYGSSGSRRELRRLVLEGETQGRPSCPLVAESEITIAELLVSYWRFQCRECRNRDERERRDVKTQKKFIKFAKRINAVDHDPFVVVAVTCELTKHFGGVEKFCARFVGAMEDAESARNHAAVSSYLGAVIQLSTDSSQMIEKSTDDSDVSTEDLKRQADRQLVELVRSQPELGVWAVRQIGWKLVPADEVGKD